MSARPRTLAGVGLLLTLVAAGPALGQCPDGTPPPCAARQAAPSPQSIAVLPFVNRSPDTADVYLAEGMTDEVGSHLTQVSRLKVKARGVVAAAWQRNPDPLGAARALRVAWYVQGTVRHVAPQLLVSVELVRPATGEEVWAKRFARSDGDLFAAQAEVAESVAMVVGGRLSPGERAVLARRPTRNNEAYRLYLSGNALLSRRTQPDVRRAVEAYTEALRLDPSFAGAWARLGMARAIQYSWTTWREGVPRDSLLTLAWSAAERALRLDSTSSDGWLALGLASSNAGDLGTAMTSYERSLRLDSLNAEAFHAAGVQYGADAEYSFDIPEAAAPLLRRALALDPTLRNTWRHLADVSRDAGRLAEAEALCDTALAFGPWAAFDDRAYIRFLRGNAGGALADRAEGERLDSASRPDDRALFTVLRGDSAPARAVLARLRVQADSGQRVLAALARFEITLGNRAEALSALERLRSRVNPQEPRCSPTAACSASLDTWRALHDPIFAPLHDDPRFQRLWQETRPVVPWLEGYH